MTDSPSSSSGQIGLGARTSQVPPDDFDPEPKGSGARILVAIFVGVPFLALLAAVPLAWGWGLGWHDVVIGGFFYAVYHFLAGEASDNGREWESSIGGRSQILCPDTPDPTLRMYHQDHIHCEVAF